MADGVSLKDSTSSTHKKVVIRQVDKTLVKGYVDPGSYLGPDTVEVLDHHGHVRSIPLGSLKGIFFVREFNGNPQRAERKLSHSRPKHGGLWVRVTFRDNEVLEGLLPNNLLDVDPRGFLVSPLDVYSNNVKMFIPRNAITSIEVLGVISEPGRRGDSRQAGAKRRAAKNAAQMRLFASP